MQTPLFFTGTVLIFWGWQTELLPFAVIMAVLVEASRWIHFRWEFTGKEIHRLVDLITLLCIGVGVYLLIKQSVRGLFELLIWFPVLLYPLLLAQVYSMKQRIPLSALFLSLRRLGPGHKLYHRELDFAYSYALICLLSASVAHAEWFFPGAALLGAWGLWPIRSRRYSPLIWGSMIVLALGFAYIGQLGIHQAQLKIEQWMLAWFEHQIWNLRDPYRQHTAIGDIGELKLSNEILFRVEAEQPTLLRQASYNSYFNGTWRTERGNFKNFVSNELPRLGEAPLDRDLETAKISLFLEKGKGMLPLPTALRLLELPEGPLLQHNPYGAIKLTQGPDLLRYRVKHGQRTPLDSPPGREDFRLPSNEENFIRKLAGELGLMELTPHQQLARVKAFFAENFAYSLKQERPRLGFTPLEHFLLNRRAGHCEYFATATALLLRAAGLPTRYASGFAAQEYSHLENAYVVRQRHAHSWVLVYLDGAWRDLDTTPSIWVAEEEADSEWWEPGYDLLAWLHYLYQSWVWREVEDENAGVNWLSWLLLPLILLLFWRVAGRKRMRRKHGRQQDWGEGGYPGEDSPFYQVIQRLHAEGHSRQPGEPLAHWLQRIIQESSPPEAGMLWEMAALHNRYRFDPGGLEQEAREHLSRQVTEWLRQRKKTGGPQ